MDVTVGDNFIVRVKKGKKELIISTLPKLFLHVLPKMSEYTIELLKIPLKVIRKIHILKEPAYNIVEKHKSVLVELIKAPTEKQCLYLFIYNGVAFLKTDSQIDLKNSNNEWLSDSKYVYVYRNKYLRKEVDIKNPFIYSSEYHKFDTVWEVLCWAKISYISDYKYIGMNKYIDSDGKEIFERRKVPYSIITYKKSDIVFNKHKSGQELITEFVTTMNKDKEDKDKEYKEFKEIKNDGLKIDEQDEMVKNFIDKSKYATYCEQHSIENNKQSIIDGKVEIVSDDFCAFKIVSELLLKKYGTFFQLRNMLKNHLKLFSVFDIDDTVIFTNMYTGDTNTHPETINFIKTLRSYGKIIFVTARPESSATMYQLKKNGIFKDDDMVYFVDADDSKLVSDSKWAIRQKLKETYGTEIVNVGDQLSDHMKHDDYPNFLKILQKNTKINKILLTDDGNDIRGDPELMLTNLKKLTFPLVYKTKDDDVLHIKLKNLNEFVL